MPRTRARGVAQKKEEKNKLPAFRCRIWWPGQGLLFRVRIHGLGSEDALCHKMKHQPQAVHIQPTPHGRKGAIKSSFRLGRFLRNYLGVWPRAVHRNHVGVVPLRRAPFEGSVRNDQVLAGREARQPCRLGMHLQAWAAAKIGNNVLDWASGYRQWLLHPSAHRPLSPVFMFIFIYFNLIRPNKIQHKLIFVSIFSFTCEKSFLNPCHYSNSAQQATRQPMHLSKRHVGGRVVTARARLRSIKENTP